MKIRELVKDSNNLFDFIDYFSQLDTNFNELDTKKYWNEFIVFYGNHELYESIENLFIVDGLMGIGNIFDLKTIDWLEKRRLSEILNTPVEEINKIVETKSAMGTGKDSTLRAGTDSKSNNYVSFDNVDTERESNAGETSETLTSDRENSEEYTLTRYETGYNSEYYSFILESFKNYDTYRKNIYQDIVNMICLQIY